MHNIILHSLANRRGPFVSGIFPSSDFYNPKLLSEPIEKIRTILGLNVIDDDQYLFSILSAIEIFSDYKKVIPEEVTTYDITRFPVQEITSKYQNEVNLLSKDKYLVKLIVHVGLLDEFTNSKNIIEKIAIIGIALAKAIINE